MIIPVTITPPAPPTRGARDLGERLAKTIEEFQRSHLHLSTAEIRQALKLAQEDGGASDSRLAVKGLLVGLLALFGVAVFAYRRMGNAGPEQGVPLVLIIIGGLAVVLALVAAVKRMR